MRVISTQASGGKHVPNKILKSAEVFLIIISEDEGPDLRGALEKPDGPQFVFLGACCTLEDLLLTSVVQPFCSCSSVTFHMDICAWPTTKLICSTKAEWDLALVSADPSALFQELLVEYETTSSTQKEVNTINKPLHHVWSSDR